MKVYCENNDYTKALKMLDTMRDMKGEGKISLENFVDWLVASANAFADNDNLCFFDEFHTKMQDINTIDPRINRFSRKACSYYYSAKNRSYILSHTGVSNEQYTPLSRLLAELSVTDNKWLKALSKETLMDSHRLLQVLENCSNRGIPLFIETRKNETYGFF